MLKEMNVRAIEKADVVNKSFDLKQFFVSFINLKQFFAFVIESQKIFISIFIAAKIIDERLS